MPRQNVRPATQSLFDKFRLWDLPAVIRSTFASVASPHVSEGRSNWTIANERANERALVASLPLGAMRRGHAQGMTNLDIQVLDTGATVRPENITGKDICSARCPSAGGRMARQKCLT